MTPEAIGVWAGVLFSIIGAAILFGSRISKLETKIDVLEHQVETLIERFDAFNAFWRRPGGGSHGR
jgi:hypothetical protein